MAKKWKLALAAILIVTFLVGGALLAQVLPLPEGATTMPLGLAIGAPVLIGLAMAFSIVFQYGADKFTQTLGGLGIITAIGLLAGCLFRHFTGG